MQENQKTKILKIIEIQFERAEKMNDKQSRIVTEILEAESTFEKIMIFKSENMDGIQILLFDEEKSNMKGLCEKNFGLYHVLPLADYNKLWVLDNKCTDAFELKVSKLINFDINIIERLDKYYKGKIIEDRENFEELLLYIKEEGYDVDVLTAVIERLGKQYDYESVKRTLGAFYKYMTNNCRIDDETLYKDENFDEFCKKCFDTGNLYNNYIVLQRQYDFIWCILAKAFLIKIDKSCKNKFDVLLDFCLNDLKCVMHKELYLLALYFKNDPNIGKVFAKLSKDYNKGIEYALENTTWDLFHSRMILEHTRFYDTVDNIVVLPYFATNDKGVYQYLSKCLYKAVIIDHGKMIPVYRSSIEFSNYIMNESLQFQLYDKEQISKRKDEVKKVNINIIKSKLLQELKTI